MVKPKNLEKMGLFDEESVACQKCLCLQCTVECGFEDACAGCTEEEREPTLHCWKTDDKGKLKEEVK